MNARLEEMTGAQILKLSIVGAGITVNRLLLDYFLTEHHTDSVVYVLDSFGFYSAEWNEDRLQDAALLHRTPFDPTLAWLLLRNPATRAVARDYVVVFSKINNRDRFVPDVLEGEGNRFDRTYRPVPQIDRQRIAYLYPDAIDEATLQDSPYLAAFEDLIGEVQSRNIWIMVIRPPIPARNYAVIPNEAQFDATLQALLDRSGVEFHNFSLVDNDEELYFDSDHLNQAGVLSFYENHLADLLVKAPGGRVGLQPARALAGGWRNNGTQTHGAHRGRVAGVGTPVARAGAESDRESLAARRGGDGHRPAHGAATPTFSQASTASRRGSSA